jgi:hypothetical protein
MLLKPPRTAPAPPRPSRVPPPYPASTVSAGTDTSTAAPAPDNAFDETTPIPMVPLPVAALRPAQPTPRARADPAAGQAGRGRGSRRRRHCTALGSPGRHVTPAFPVRSSRTPQRRAGHHASWPERGARPPAPASLTGGAGPRPAAGPVGVGRPPRRVRPVQRPGPGPRPVDLTGLDRAGTPADIPVTAPATHVSAAHLPGAQAESRRVRRSARRPGVHRAVARFTARVGGAGR